MQDFLIKLDDLADIKIENNLIRWLERAAFVFMILMFVSAPHSIAATQIAWLTGMFVWVVRLFFKPRPRLVRTPLDIPLWIFFIWSIVSSIFSYDPPTSLDKLRNVALFLIFYYVINVVRTKRAVIFLALAMITSTMVSVVWTPIERIIGRGVEIVGAAKESTLTKALLLDGDTLLKADGVKIKTPDDLIRQMQANETTKLFVYRPDFYFTVEVKRADLLGGADALEQLGIAGWKRSRNWRSAGFYGHYTTFAEVLQLVASLAFGLFIAHFLRRGEEWRSGGVEEMKRRRDKTSEQRNFSSSALLLFSSSPLLLFSLAAMTFALLLTVTRASQLGFLVSAATIVLLLGNRKMFLTLAAVILPIALIGLVFLQQSRQIGFFDAQDESIKWRQTVYREGIDLWTKNERHFLLGVGMDSVKKYAKEWRLFDDGRLPMGHFHSTPLQLLVERGTPALLLWLWILWIYGRMLLKVPSPKSQVPSPKSQVPSLEEDNPKSQIPNPKSADGWRERGILLGCFGGMVGFFTAGFVHYNLGDAEVAMVFFMLMGLGAKLKRDEG